jgi:hypothetical protein
VVDASTVGWRFTTAGPTLVPVPNFAAIMTNANTGSSASESFARLLDEAHIKRVGGVSQCPRAPASNCYRTRCARGLLVLCDVPSLSVWAVAVDNNPG